MSENVRSAADWAALCRTLRLDILDIVESGHGGHIGGDMSVVDILAVLYFHVMRTDPAHADDPDRNRFLLSKGHAMEAYYAVLARRGFLELSDVIARYGTFNTPYIGHPNNKLPGIEMNSGSLGHGLPAAVGMALAGRMDKRNYRVYTVMGDGETAEGSVWEAAMAAAHYRLDRLCAVIDRNRLQISGTTEQVLSHENLAERFCAFGWEVVTCDGNDPMALIAAFDKFFASSGKPFLIVADTVKGCGVSFMENRAEWHHRLPTDEEFARARQELSVPAVR